jgi:hypothetical protein
MKGDIKIGYTVGNGAAINIELGFIPDYAAVYNVTDGDLLTEAFLGPHQVVPFSSGGTATIAAGNEIIGATSAARARVVEVLTYSGTFAGGDAAGFFVVEMISGTFQSENVKLSGGTDDATVTANVVHNVATAAAVAGATGNAALSRYVGSVGSGKRGFTIGSTVAEEAKLLRYIAIRGDY